MFISESDVFCGRILNIFEVQGYTFINGKTLDTRGKTRISCWYDSTLERMSDLEDDLNEIIVLKDKSARLSRLIVGIYQPFKLFENETFRGNFTRLLNNLTRVVSTTQEVVIVGDFNVPYNNAQWCPLRALLEEWSNEHVLDQLISVCTRARMVNRVLQESILDLIFTNVNNVNVSQMFNQASDHNIITFNFKNKQVGSHEREKRVVRFLDWSQYSAERICESFVQNFSGYSDTLNTSNLINECISYAIIQSLNKWVPKRKCTLYGKDPVVNPIIRKLKNKKSKLFKKWTSTKNLDTFDQLRDVSRKLNKEIMILKKKQFENDLKGDAKRYWGAINKISGKNVNQNVVNEFVIDGTHTKNELKIANAFMNHFCKKVEDLSLNSEVDNFVIPDPTNDLGTGEMWNAGLFFCRNDICDGIDGLKRKKAQGVDEIPGNVVKDLKNVIAEPLTWLFNTIIETGQIPTAWKTSKIVPVFKKGDKKLINNYRPVSNTSSLSKVFEKCLIKKIENLYGYDRLMGIQQHAYRPGCSTVTGALTLQDFIASEIDRGNKVVVYSTDLTAAFDLLRPNLLIKKLVELGFPKSYINVILDFLTARLGFVDMNGTYSFVKHIPLGCVQGSVLGPFLFNLYTSDLQEIIQAVEPSSHVMVYADDAYVAIPFEHMKFPWCSEITARVFLEHITWLKDIGMVCNYLKTDIAIFGFNGPGITMTLGGSRIMTKDNIKVLGIIFDSNLKWSAHVESVIKKACSSIYSLRQLNRFLDRQRHRETIHSFFISHVMYAAPVWGDNISFRDSRRIDSILFKIMRIHCFDNGRTMTNIELCTASKIRNFKSLRKIANSIMLHSLISTPQFNTCLTERLIAQSTFNSRWDDQIRFFDYSTKRVGRNSVINRAKYIAEEIPFAWPDLSNLSMRLKIKEATPLLL